MPGIDANFCSPVKENLLCGLCGLPLRKPVQISSCGHRFCESCLDDAFEPLRGGEQELLRCPADQLEVKQSQVYLDESSGKKIQSLTVLCRHCSQGCKWKGQLRKLKSHLTSCDFGVIECSNKCGLQLMRSQLAEHVRNLCSNRHVSCATCHQDIPREDYEKHSRSCGKDDNTTASKLRKQIKNISRTRHESASFNSSSSHEQQPPMRAVSVPAQLNFVGRTDVPRRTAEEWHGTTGRRRSRRSRHLIEQDDVIEETVQEEQVAELPNNAHDSLSRIHSAPLRQRSDFGSQVVYVGSSENPPQTSDPRELFTCVCGALMANEEITTHMSEECPKRLTLCQYCRKQVGHAELQEHLRDCTRFPLSCPNSCGVRQIPREEMNCHVTNDCSAILETCPFKYAGCQHKCPRSNINRHMEHKMKEHLNLMCKMTVKQSKQISELQSVVKHCKPFNQAQLLWKIEKFSSVLETAKEVTGYEVHSPPFFTDQYGYKFMIVAFPNGNGSGEGTHLSLYVRLLVGEYDPLLKWPFLGDITLTLIDQSQDTTKQRHISQNFSPDPKWTSFHRPKKSSNSPGFGYPQFASHETLKARQYLVDDALFIRGTVELPQIIEA